VCLTLALATLAAACSRTDYVDEGLKSVTDALLRIEHDGERWWEAKIQWLRGELLPRQNDSSSAQAQSCFECAMQIASRQGAKSLQLRTTMSLGRLLASQGHREEARAILGEIYNWFTEGFDTADLKEAKALDELSR
jgi:predicted ATPase